MMAEENSDDDISSLGLTATTSTLDTATEKLILENIMAENDDDDDDEEEDAELAALLNTSSDIDIDDDDNINVVSSSQRRVEQSTKVTTAIADDAFSSSSEEEEFNDEDSNDGGGTTAAAATTPRFSNRGAVNNYTLKDNDTANNTNTTTAPHSIYPSQQPQQHQQDFSWVSSADDDTVDASNTNLMMRGPQPSLSMRISEDTIDIVEGDSVGGNDNNIIDNNTVSVSSGTNTTHSTTATKQPMGSTAPLKLPQQQLQSTTPTPPPPPHCSSPFDQALHEVKKRGGGHHSRTNSFTFESPTASGNTTAFTFENTTPPAAAANNASVSSSAAVAPVATTLSSSPGTTPVAAVAAAMLANNPYVDLNVNQHDEHHNGDNNDEGHDDDDSSYDEEENDDDDDDGTNNDTFFAKADNMAVDEILYAASGEVEVEEERGTEKQHVVQQQQQQQQHKNVSAASSADATHATEGEEDNMGFQSLNIVNISTEDEGGVEVYSPSQSAMPSTTDPSSTGGGGGGGNSKSANSSAATVGGKTTTTTTSGGTTIKATNTTSNNNMMQMIQNTTTATTTLQKYYKNEEERESMRRSFQQSISAAVLVSLAHKRYERRRLAAMEIEKVVRSYVMTEDYPRVRAILLLLSDDYVRSTNEDARKGGAVALAACAIGLKKANEGRRDVIECRDLILASVVHACQDHSQRVRYYATESLFNVTKVIPSLAVRHFFILFEILRSLYADVDLDVRSGAELLDKKLKEVIVGAINSGSFSADACVPVFARFVYMRNKATKQLTLTWLQEFSEKLVGDPILEFLHLFLGGIFAMIADPNATIRQLALEFLQLVLPKLLFGNNEDFEDAQQKVDFDKILQSLVLTMEHPDPFVRKVAMYWMLRIVQAHMSSAFPTNSDQKGGEKSVAKQASVKYLTAASTSVRNALPHVLPGILVSIGDTHQSRAKDTFLPDQTTHNLAEQANTCLQDAVRRDGKAFIPHLGGFVVALREELDSPGGLIARNPPSIERRPYRMDVKPDGSGIESTGWFRASDGVEERDNALILSRLCALQWVVVLYEHVVPNSLKAEYASEFIDCIIYQLVDQPPGIIVVKSFEVLAKITVPAKGQEHRSIFSALLTSDDHDSPEISTIPSMNNPMDDENANFALGILEPFRRRLVSRDRAVFAALIDLHSKHEKLLMDVSKVIELMCTLQPPEFIFIAFATELENFIVSKMQHRKKIMESPETDASAIKEELAAFSKDLAFVSNFAQQLGLVFFAAPETEQLRLEMKDCIGFKGDSLRDEQRAFLTASSFLQKIDPLDVSLMFYLELDRLIDLIERPIFRHLHLRLLECEDDPYQEGSGAMLFRTLKSILMVLPQSTSYVILKERLSSTARFRQSAVALRGLSKHVEKGSKTDIFVKRLVKTRKLHCDAKWRNIRAESLEDPSRLIGEEQKLKAAQQRREWLGYADEEDEIATKEKMKKEMLEGPGKAEMVGVYEGLDEMQAAQMGRKEEEDNICETCIDAESEDKDKKGQWREYWASHQ
ncbi:vacuole morphology and inheritance protein 14 [Skeletonema marinoi]|uniref:Vacuole morphology and inheritance protein 14 n=1 Tax=Skeletonema marinoi TaxID=267567 RepID=A0AAD8Y0L6_9STRA|nr:vacuole morphology and inheritance protein 14 [Skeletonema marinoi]